MNEELKSEIACLGVRFLGCLLLIYGIVQFCSGVLVYFYYQYYFATTVAGFTGNPWAYPQFIVPCISGLFPLLIGLYLLRNGKIVHRWMAIGMGKNQQDSNQHELFEDSLEVESFDSWLKENPSFQGRAKVDQIALFRESR